LTARAAAALSLLALAGCAHHSSQTRQPARTTPTPSHESDPANEPYGRLSPTEKRTIVREYRALKPLSEGSESASELDRGRRACQDMTQPGTALVARVRTDCNNAIQFFGALRGLEHAGDDCGGASERDRLLCVRDRLVAVAHAIATTSSGASAINDELRRRGITGLCARSIGITEPQLAAYRRAELAARRGVDALTVGDADGLERATSDLTDALGAGGSDDPLRGIERGCKTSGRKPLPRVPTGDSINA
jgi:hypothetical protein